MPSNYGEGEEAALKRLRREIHADQNSLIRDPQLEASIDQCLAHLRVTDPRDDRSRIESTKGGLLKESYRWILEHKDFQQWRDDSDRHLLWIKGDPGKGKTMLLCGITEELSGAPADQCLVSYFFYQATDANLNNATAVLRGLIYMLVKQDRSLAKHLYDECKIAGQRLFEDSNAWAALTRILTSMTQDDQHGNLVFVIDALDECAKDRAKLLDLIIRQSQTGLAKWLVSSRNWPEIEERLETAARNVRLSLELNAKSISAAVKIYIRHQVDELQRSKRLDQLKRNEIIEYLVTNADNTFLWVALVCERLRALGVRARHIMQKLRQYPAGLDFLYDRMMQYINNSIDSEACRDILGTMGVTYRPVSLVELAVLIKLESIDLTELKELIKSCGSFLIIRDDVVYFVHQSAKEFLTRSTASTIFPFGIGPKHASVSMSSIRALLQSLQRDMYNLHKPGASIRQVQPPSPDPLAPLRYSCTFWVDHVIEGYSPDELQCPDMIGLVYQLLQKKFLYWLEALSLIRNVPSGISSIAKLLQFVQSNDKGKYIQGLIYDIFRILQYFDTVIAQYPLQAYVTTLVFSPTESVVRELFPQEGPQWLLLKPHVEQQWSAHQRTLEGHTDSVYSVAFSPDGGTVTSGSFDQTVRLWDMKTGVLQCTLEGHTNSVQSVTFSPDGGTIASASFDQTVRLWDARTGVLQRTLEGHTDSVQSVAFSPDGRTVVSGSRDKTIRLWDTKTGVLQRTLEGHTDSVYSVAFSPDSGTITSGSYDDTVRLWDTKTGMLQRTLEGHTDSVQWVAFSPDGGKVASGSRDQTVRLWNAKTGVLQRTLEGHMDSVQSVAFSPSGDMVASGSRDKTVRIWDTKTGVLQRTLDSHTDSVYSVACSPSGDIVASGSRDNTIRLWDAKTGVLQRTLESHTDSVDLLAFSPDGDTVASGSRDKTVRLWDAKTGMLQRTLEGHTDSVYSVVFSLLGDTIASGSRDKTIRLWVAKTGVLHHTLESHTDSVYSVAFSLDSGTVVSGSRDNTVRLWDVKTGVLQRTLEGHADSVDSVAFSTDSDTVASGSRDRTVRLWDAKTGVLQRTLEGHTDSVYSVVFSPLSDTIASGSRDKTIRIWDAKTGVLQRTLEGHTDSVYSVAFSPDGGIVASGSRDNTVRIWDAKTGGLLQALKIGITSSMLGFNANSTQVLTDVGAFSIQRQFDGVVAGRTMNHSSSLAKLDQNFGNGPHAGYGVSQDRNWIEFQGENILWLPVECRPVASAVVGSTVALGCASGRVLIMRFHDRAGL